MSDRELPLFPLNVVLFPGMRLPLHIFEERYKEMIGSCMASDQTFGVVLIRSGEEVGAPAEYLPVGTTARITHLEPLPEGRMNLVAVGVDRFRVVERLGDLPYARARVQIMPDREDESIDPISQRVADHFRRYLVGKGLTADQAGALKLPSEPLALSYLVAATLKAPSRQRQVLLEEGSVGGRLRRELALMEWELGGPDAANARSFSTN